MSSQELIFSPLFSRRGLRDCPPVVPRTIRQLHPPPAQRPPSQAAEVLMYERLLSDAVQCSGTENTAGRTENPRVAGSIPALATNY